MEYLDWKPEAIKRVKEVGLLSKFKEDFFDVWLKGDVIRRYHLFTLPLVVIAMFIALAFLISDQVKVSAA